MTIQTHLVSVPFKGQRKYIQGPDLVDLALNFFNDQDLSRAKFSAHSFVEVNSLAVTISSKELPSEGAVRGQVFTKAGTFWLTITAAEAQGTPPAPVPFDEALVTDVCTMAGNSIILPQVTPYSLTENIVSMQKALLEHMHPSTDGKWIFASVDYSDICQTWDQLEVRVDHNFQNKLVKSSILVNGARIGFLYFSLVSS